MSKRRYVLILDFILSGYAYSSQGHSIHINYISRRAEIVAFYI